MTESHTDHGSHGDHASFAHPMPVWGLWAVLFSLLFLTVVTVVAADFQLGALDIWISMAIATVKAGLVIFLFMHLIHDKAFNGLVFFFSVFFLALFLGFLLMDTGAYQDQIKEQTYDTIQQEQSLQ